MHSEGKKCACNLNPEMMTELITASLKQLLLHHVVIDYVGNVIFS